MLEPPLVVAAAPRAENVDIGESIFAKPSSKRFSEIIKPTLKWLQRTNKWKSDMAQRESIAERFAWITGDKPLCEYSALDVDHYINALHEIPSDLGWGKLHEEGPMAIPFADFVLPKIKADKKRNDRTVNRDLSVMQSISKVLADTHWRPKYGMGLELDFTKWMAKIGRIRRAPFVYLGHLTT